MPDQKPIWTRCLGGFSVMWVTKLLISPGKIRIFCPFRSISDQKPMWTRCPGGFSAMWVTKLLISPGKIRIYCNSLGIFVSLFLQVNALCDPSTGAIIQKIVQDKYRSLPCSIMWTSCFCQTESSSFCLVGIVLMEIWTADFVNNIDKFLCS